MRIWLARFLLLSFLFAGTELHQVLRLPALVLHFVEHQATSPDLSFVAFLQEHYSGPEINYPGEDEKHEKLPFKDNHCLQVHFSVVAIPVVASLALQEPAAELLNTQLTILPTANLVCPAYNGDVWNPPKA